MNSERRNTKGAAAYLGEGVSPRTLEALRVRGGGPVYIKLGKRVLYDTVDLDDWLATKRRHSTTVPAVERAESVRDFGVADGGRTCVSA